MKPEQSMVDEISDLLKNNMLVPIAVQTLNDDCETVRYFEGTEEEFIEAAKLLGAKSIFIEPMYLEEDEFYYDSGMDDDEYMQTYGADCCCRGCNCECCDCKCDSEKDCDKKESEECANNEDGVCIEPEDLDGIDLSILKPEIAKYLDKVDEICGVRLTVPGVDHLQFELWESWYEDFAELVDEASDIIEDDPAEALKKLQDKYKAEESEKATDEIAKDESVKKIAVHPPKKD